MFAGFPQGSNFELIFLIILLLILVKRGNLKDINSFLKTCMLALVYREKDDKVKIHKNDEGFIILPA